MRPRKTREQRLLERIRVLEQVIDSAPLVLQVLPAEYVLELGALAGIAYHGVKRPEDRGYTLAMHAESRPPAANPEAQQALYREQADLHRRAHELAGTVRSLDPAAGAGVESSSPGVESYQTRRVAHLPETRS